MSEDKPELFIRTAIAADAEAVGSLYKASFPEHIMVHRGILCDPGYLRDHFQNPDERWVVTEPVGREGNIKGVAALAVAPPVGLGEIERVCVNQEFRGNGAAQHLCHVLVEEARTRNLGFVEAFARGDQPGMQRTFEKLGFAVYGVAPRFEVVHQGRIVREEFVHMGLLLKPETVDSQNMELIPAAQKIFNRLHQEA